MILTLSTWPEVEAQLARSRTIVVPVGSTEQHGPTGLIGTDALCPEIIAREAERADEAILVGPTFNVGMAQHHMAFPGTLTLRPSTFIAAVRDWTESLAAHGFDRIYWLNGHGGNIATLQAAFSEIDAEHSLAGRPTPVQLRLRNWWELPGVMGLIGELFPTGHGGHATPSEVAVTQWAYPDRIKTAELSPRIAPTGPIRDAQDYRARFPDGRIGSDPAQATPEKGGRIVALAAEALRAELGAFAEPTGSA